jgi:hypothetical protein
MLSTGGTEGERGVCIICSPILHFITVYYQTPRQAQHAIAAHGARYTRVAFRTPMPSRPMAPDAPAVAFRTRGTAHHTIAAVVHRMET